MTIDELLAAAGLTANDEIPIWDAEATGEPTKKITAQNLAAAVVALANLVTGVKGDAEQNYRHGDVNLTPANIGAVNKAGDTMTGVFEDANALLKLVDNSRSTYQYKYCLSALSPNMLSGQKMWMPLGKAYGNLGETGGLRFDYNNSGNDSSNNALVLGFWGRDVLIAKVNGDIDLYKPLSLNNGGTGATTPAGACAALAPGIPTSSYDTGITWTSTTTTFNANDGVRCIKYGNGLKRICGLFIVSGSGVAGDSIIFSVPTGYEYDMYSNGGIQGWGNIVSSSGGASYLFRFLDNNVFLWSSAIPAGIYAINYLYF